MANINVERKLAIDTAILELKLKVITASDIIKGTMDLLERSGPQNPQHVATSVYTVIRRYVKIGRLVKVPHSMPPSYTKNLAIEDRPEQDPDILAEKDVEEVVEIFSTWARNIQLKPEEVTLYQNKISELASEIETLKNIHALEVARMKVEYKKVADKLNSFLTLAKATT